MYHNNTTTVLNQKELTPRFRLFTVTDTVTIEPVVIRPASSSSSRTVKEKKHLELKLCISQFKMY